MRVCFTNISMHIIHDNDSSSLNVGHEFDKKQLKKKIQHGVFGLVKVNKQGSMFFIKEASKQGHTYDEREGLRVKDIDKALDEI